MSLRINNNVAAMTAHRNLTVTHQNLKLSLEKLSSGYRINRAADDAAGMAVSQSMRAQVAGLRQAKLNGEQGINLIQTAEGALDEAHNILTRMKELAVEASNETLSSSDLSKLNEEYGKLKSELDRINSQTKFNGVSLFSNTGQSGSIDIQVGLDSGQTVSIDISNGVDAEDDLSLGTIDSSSNANTELGAIDTAIGTLSTVRSDLGATQNQLEHTVKNLANVAENTQASESVIRDADMAFEMANFTRNSIMIQAGTAMLAQANSTPQSVLGLLG